MNNINYKKSGFKKYFLDLLEAFLYPINRSNIIDTFSLLVVSGIVIFMPLGAFLVKLLLFSCAIVYFKRRIKGKQEEGKEHIFAYAFKIFPIVFIIEFVKFLSILIFSFESLPHSNPLITYIFTTKHVITGVYVKQSIVELVLFFFLVPFLILCANREKLYFETKDIIRTLKLIKEKFIQLFLIFLPYLICVSTQ